MAKILVVDDSESVRLQLSNDLKASGHAVIAAENGQTGLQAVQQNADIQLIICDVNMPIMDGLTMMEHLHENEVSRKIPKFMLTTEASPELKQRAKAVGVRAWIIKPYAVEKLLGAVKSVLG